MTTRAIAISTLWQIASQALTAILSAIAVKCVALGLSKELAGAYNSAYGYLQLFAILADFGLYAVSVKECSQSKEKPRVLGALLVLRVVITTLALGSAIAIAWIVPAWRGTPLPLGIAIASLVPFFTLLAGVLRTTFQITFRMHIVFIAEVTQKAFTVTLMAGVLWWGIRGSTDLRHFALFLWIGAGGSLLLFALSAFFAERILPVRPCFDRALLTMLLRRAAPYGIAYLCIALYRQFDLTMIALLREDFATQNAEYGFAQRIAEMTYLVPTYILNSTLPVLSERRAAHHATDDLLGKTLLLLAIVGGSAAMLCGLWARPLMQLLTTEAYLSTTGTAGADTALRMLAIPIALNAFVLYSFYVLLALHRWRPLVLSMLTGVAVSILLNVWLIPLYGFRGAIMTSTLVHVLLAILLLSTALRLLPARLPARHITRTVGFLATMACILFLLSPLLTSTLSTMLACVFLPLCAACSLWVWRLHELVHSRSM